MVVILPFAQGRSIGHFGATRLCENRVSKIMFHPYNCHIIQPYQRGQAGGYEISGVGGPDECIQTANPVELSLQTTAPSGLRMVDFSFHRLLYCYAPRTLSKTHGGRRIKENLTTRPNANRPTERYGRTCCRNCDEHERCAWTKSCVQKKEKRGSESRFSEHIDENNMGPSKLIGLGNYKGGDL